MATTINPSIVSGDIMGRCPKCSNSFAGTMDYKDISNTATIPVSMKCLNPHCRHTGEYFIRWPDELPKVQLRHTRNRQLVSSGRKGPRRKKKKENPDGVLRGQMSFAISEGIGQMMRTGIIT